MFKNRKYRQYIQILIDRKIVKTVKPSPLSFELKVMIYIELTDTFSDLTRTSGWLRCSLSCRQTDRMSGILRRLYLMQEP